MADIARRRLRRQIPGGNNEIAALTACLLAGMQPWLDLATGCSA
jgi:hypothetical protein